VLPSGTFEPLTTYHDSRTRILKHSHVNLRFVEYKKWEQSLAKCLRFCLRSFDLVQASSHYLQDFISELFPMSLFSQLNFRGLCKNEIPYACNSPQIMVIVSLSKTDLLT